MTTSRARDTATVGVEVCTGWTRPDAPRDLDGPAVADQPDLVEWLAALDRVGPEGRLGLHGRTLTQLVKNEPVDIVERAGDWVRVVAPWQPSATDPRGYLCWVRSRHLFPSDAEPAPLPPAQVAPDPVAIARAASDHVGLRYLWGGTTPYGLDCSGLIHHTYRRAGIVVPRDAHDQWAAATPVTLGEEQPGDLYFFAREDGRAFHVGFVTGDRTMLHAPETGELIEDAPIAPHRVETLFAAGRLLS
jgi:gamma-D-glutamyl-L-lysine dipeptidyl-peptidase